jgi:nucleoside-diphosphate-sugar epimerase
VKVFVTGATGFIGSAVVPELIQAGHHVIGMARYDRGSAALEAAGAEVHRGTLEDLDSLRSGAAKADAVVHLAFIHDYSNFEANCKADSAAITAMGETLAGTGRPLIGTAGVLGNNLAPGQPSDEDEPKRPAPFGRVSEEATLATIDKGVKGIVVRLSQIHDTAKQGLISYWIRTALEKKEVAYVGDGSARWAAAHISDTARLYRLVLEKAKAGSKWHAVGEQGVTAKDIAETLGARLNLPVVSLTPEEAPAYFGFLGHFASLDAPASNTKTRERLGWEPTGPTLIEDLRQLAVIA